MSFDRRSSPFHSISPNIVSAKHLINKHPSAAHAFDPMDNRILQTGSDGASDSPYEGLQENDTEDSFGKRMIREMRAENPRPQAFRKARPRVRHGLTMENLERIPVTKGDTTPQYVQRQAGSVTSSGDSRGSDPPPNVPKAWGTRSRKPEWLKRRFAAEVEAFSEALRAGTTDTIDWSAVAVDVPLPSVEDTPLSHKSSRRSTPATDGAKRNTKLDEIVQLEQDEDFSMRDLITSTPAIVSRNTKLDEIRQLELENALREAVDDSIYPTPPPEDRRKRRRSTPSDHRIRSRSPKEDQDMANSWSHPAEQEIDVPDHSERRSTSRRLTGDNAPVSPGKGSHTVGDIDRGVQPNVQTNIQRPNHHREDSQDILRRLARAASGTPSPSRLVGSAINALSPKRNKQAKFKEENPEIVAKVDFNAEGANSGNVVIPKQSDFAAEPEGQFATVGHPSPQHNQPRDSQRKPLSDVTSLENSLPKALEPKTPIVTGGWIETPKHVTTARRPHPITAGTPPAAPDVDEKAVKPEGRPECPSTAPSESTKPLLPSSALTAVLSSTENGLGDSTITSLEDILGHTPGLGDDTLTNIDLPPYVPKTSAEQLRYKELQTLRKMNAQLRATRESIRDAKLGIGRVERAVQASDGTGAAAAGEVGESQCKHCGHHASVPHHTHSSSLVASKGHPEHETANAPLIAIFISLKGIVWYLSPDTGRKKLTWLALLAVVFWGWFWAELVACVIWCRPVYSYDGTLRPDAPEWPLVIPTLILSPFGFIWRPVWGVLKPAVVWVWDFACFMWEDERLKEEWRKAATMTASKVLTTATTRWMGMPTAFRDSMDNDELL